jgi:hypothetical protein
MTSFALMTSDQLNARLTGILEILQEKDEIYPACVRDLADEARCLQKVLIRRSSVENLDKAGSRYVFPGCVDDDGALRRCE